MRSPLSFFASQETALYYGLESFNFPRFSAIFTEQSHRSTESWMIHMLNVPLVSGKRKIRPGTTKGD
jgi:hypothetical protein